MFCIKFHTASFLIKLDDAFPPELEQLNLGLILMTIGANVLPVGRFIFFHLDTLA